MATTIYKTKLPKKGRALALPATAWEQLHLREGDEVQVVVSQSGEMQEQISEKENPLLALCGIAKKSDKRNDNRDVAENHDKYLYGSDPM